MRTKLTEYLELTLPNPNTYDLTRTIHIANNLYSGRIELALKHQKEMENEAKTVEELFALCDDIHWYAFEERCFIWHFCLWRLQAIFEGIIISKYIKSIHIMSGLKAKLIALKKLGYNISPNDYQQLLKWAKLRNMLSHHPPSSHSPGPLEEEDVKEYYDLCIRLCKDWDTQLLQKTTQK